ncbi:MAG: hypothetical protein ACLPSW_14315 [Roseiarcus sp.]
MHRLLGACAAVVLALCSAGAEAAGAGPTGPTSRDFTCDKGPLAKDASRKKLAAALGAANVTEANLTDSADGHAYKETLLFANKPADEIEVHWADEADGARRGPIAMTVANSSNRSDWLGPLGVRLGSTIAEVEAANGRPFAIMGFAQSEGSGQVMDWRGGALATAMRNCVLEIVFNAGDVEGAAAADALIASDDPAVRAANPIVGSMALSFWQKR